MIEARALSRSFYTSRMLRFSVAWLLVLLALGCAKDPPAQRYPFRGMVMETSGSGASFLATIHHERIRGFMSRDGKQSDMASMRMSFGLAPDVDASIVAAGSKIEGEFEVRWDKTPALLIVRARQLPDDTPLALTDQK
jgi:hypothetical protein